MSEPKLISPLLDNFVMGDPISEHDGVRCCPAMEKDSENKYIVKIISVPASQTQVDALLLSGACSSQEAALTYFQELTDNIVEETKILKKLSASDGFLAVEGCQIVPMDDGVGFDIYLLCNYRTTLEKAFRRGAMTHLSALNLGLDLCAALAVARKSGYLYVDLKPENVYISEQNTYKIGDLGFMKLNSLKYASLPQRYHSKYTAPEITDAYSCLNTTIDVYAVGLILYQAFNDGQLPVREEDMEFLSPPAYADYEMAEIILKACANDPADRYQDPIELGQALITYMQRNGAHDTPIVPSADPEETSNDPLAENEETGAYEQVESEEADETVDVSEEPAEETVEEELPEVTEESIYIEDEEGNLTFIEDTQTDETAPAENVGELDYQEVTEEVSDMLEQADDLIAHEAPEPVVQPEPIDVPIPTPITTEEEPTEAETEESAEIAQSQEQSETVAETETENEPTETTSPEVEEVEETEESQPKKPSCWIRNTLLILLGLALIAGGILFYQMFYLQPVESIVLETSDEGVLTVSVNSEIDEEKLSVICTDTYGIQISAPVVDGKAVFTQLTPNSAYTVKVVVSGFHRLTGDYSAAYTTAKQTEIVQFTAVTGSEDGSVILSFTIDGPDSNKWEISYNTEDGSAKNLEFAGHMITLTDLPVGQEFTFSLKPLDDIRVIGTTHVAHVVSKVVTAKNISVSAIIDNALTVQWAAPAGSEISGWTVRCYNDTFDKTVVTEEAKASFEITDPSASYTIEVTAAGMSVSERIMIAANSVGVTDFKIDDSSANKLALSWKPVDAPDTSNWALYYSANGSAPREISLEGKNSATISPIAPGCEYVFVLKTGDGVAVLGGTQSYTTATAPKFSDYNVSADNMEFRLCRRPGWDYWDHYDVDSSDYTSAFAADEEAGVIIKLNHEYDWDYDDINILFVISDENGSVVSVSSQVDQWGDMWYRNYCELDVPQIPSAAGSYRLSIYFNGQLAGQTGLDIVD